MGREIMSNHNNDNDMKISGMLKVAEITTENDYGCLAICTLRVSGSITKDDNEANVHIHKALLEPVDLYFVSFKTGKRVLLWKHDSSLNEYEAAATKHNAMKRFVNESDAYLIDIDGRIDTFMTNQDFEMFEGEIDLFVAAGKMNVKRSNGFKSSGEIMSTDPILRRIKGKLNADNESKKAEQSARLRWNVKWN